MGGESPNICSAAAAATAEDDDADADVITSLEGSASPGLKVSGSTAVTSAFERDELSFRKCDSNCSVRNVDDRWACDSGRVLTGKEVKVDGQCSSVGTLDHLDGLEGGGDCLKFSFCFCSEGGT